MIKIIIFDFDGVLIESAHIKTEAFRELFSKWPEHVSTIVEYHLKHAGVTRFAKFKYFYETLLNQPYSDKIGNLLSAQFADICLEKVKSAPVVSGMMDFLEKNYSHYGFYIASSSPQDELDSVIDYKQLRRYFKGAWGNPNFKGEVVKSLMIQNGLSKEEVVFIGDGESDLQAAVTNKIAFILRQTKENEYLWNSSAYKVEDGSQLESVIKFIERRIYV